MSKVRVSSCFPAKEPLHGWHSAAQCVNGSETLCLAAEILKFLQPLGSGMFGEVYHVRDLRIDADRACKIINKAHLSVPLEQVEEEIRILKSVDHPNVINIFEVFEDQQAIYILQEFCSGGELLNTLTIDKGEAKPLDEESTKDIMRQVFEGLAHIHGKRIIHK